MQPGFAFAEPTLETPVEVDRLPLAAALTALEATAHCADRGVCQGICEEPNGTGSKPLERIDEHQHVARRHRGGGVQRDRFAAGRWSHHTPEPRRGTLEILG